MKDKLLDQSVGSKSSSVTPPEPSRLQTRLLLIVGMVIGLAPVGLAAVCSSAPNQFLQESWLAMAAALYIVEWVVAAIIHAVTYKRSIQSLTKGIMWGLGITTGIAIFRLLAIAYYILTF